MTNIKCDLIFTLKNGQCLSESFNENTNTSL